MTDTPDPPCVCGEPATPDAIHRADGPCHVDGRRRTIANAIARVDAGKWGTEVPLEEHPFWLVYLAYADAVLAVLPATDRTAEEAYRLALSTALGLGTGANWEAIRDRAEDLVADETQQPETRQSCACGQDGCEYCDVDEADEEQAEADAAAVASCPGYETTPNPCRCPCYGCKHHCSAHNPDHHAAVVLPAKEAKP